MTLTAPPFSRQDVEILEEKTLYKGFFGIRGLKLRHQLFNGGWSKTITRELFDRGQAVGVVLYDPHHDLIALVEQFRVGALNEPFGPWCLEVVAGMIEPGESPEEVATRELVEEANVTTEGMDYICNYLSSPGGTDEKLHLYCGYTDLTQAGGVYGLDEEGEDIQVKVFAADDVFAHLLQGRFNNAATLICLQWLQLNRERIRAERT